MKRERDSSVPGGFQRRIGQSFSVGAMIPLRQVRVAGSVLWWGFNLDLVDTTPTLESIDNIVQVKLSAKGSFGL